MSAANEALRYLSSHHVMTLCTFGTEGPWATAVFYVNEGFTLFFLSEAGTRHGQNLSRDSRVALAVHEDYRDWREIKGLQMAGEARAVSPREKAALLPAFAAKYPHLGVFFTDPRYVAVMVRALVYRVRPREVWYLDNGKGFSRRERIVPPSGDDVGY